LSGYNTHRAGAPAFSAIVTWPLDPC